MARAARDFRVCWGRHLLPALPDFGPERPSSRLDDTWCPPIITEHFATISSGCGGARARSAVVTSSALLELPPGELPAPLTAATRLCTLARASVAALLCRHHGVRGAPQSLVAFDAAAGGVEALRCPAVARQPPRGFAAPGASASARLAPWKGHRRCTLDPAPSAGIGKSSRDTKHHGALSQAPQFCSPKLYLSV